MAQLAFAGFEILSRVALIKGAGRIAFSFYRNVIASLLLGVSGFFLETGQRPRLTFHIVCLFFILGFIGVTVNQLCYLEGLRYTSPIFASAMRNTTPVFTFIIAVLCRMEKLRIRKLDGQAKVVGTALAICGSVVLSIYRGPAVLKSKITILHIPEDPSTMQSWQLGALFLVVSCIAFALFLIMQVPALQKYPAPVSLAALSCFFSVLQLPILGVIYEPERSKWAPTGASEIISIVYAGIIASGLDSGIQSWGVYKGGPVIVAAYQPLETVVTTILSFVFLKETLHLGSVIGGVLVILGLYLLIWGQERERQIMASKVADDVELPVRSRTLRLSFDIIAPPMRPDPNSDVSSRGSRCMSSLQLPRLSSDRLSRLSNDSSERPGQHQQIETLLSGKIFPTLPSCCEKQSPGGIKKARAVSDRFKIC
ncbi:hypothetical protein O6H91_22G048300 [Diphasiastrum complanatum]|uniref:Uncharacterized protein n=1 Tax=Diphasiastrum complanatum TaxID=34168 RepID=A0ACC2AF70_DIPCM|nr:hypothetical protein O6H91_22G048300 [Diphasiastrum complanatum]